MSKEMQHIHSKFKYFKPNRDFCIITFPIFSFAHLFERNRDVAGLGYMLNSW